MWVLKTKHLINIFSLQLSVALVSPVIKFVMFVLIILERSVLEITPQNTTNTLQLTIFDRCLSFVVREAGIPTFERIFIV